jgi:riboflavin-specific deaminase-like protein
MFREETNAFRFINPVQKQQVTLTFAQTLDGVIGLYDSRLQISSADSLLVTHALRHTHDAIMLGIGAVKADNPSLTARFPGIECRHPIPVIVDYHLDTPLDAQFMDRNPILLCSAEAADIRGHLFKCRIVTVPTIGTRLDLAKGLGILRNTYKINTVMVEGGAKIISEFLNQQLADQVIITIGPKVIGRGIRYNADCKLKLIKTEQFGEDLVIKLVRVC